MTYLAVNHDGRYARIDLRPMTEEEETMAVRIVRGLEAKNLSQAHLSRILGVARATVNQWCLGTSEPRPRTLVAIAELLFDGDVHYLVHGPKREPEGGFPSLPPRRPASARSPSDIGSPVVRRKRI